MCILMFYYVNFKAIGCILKFDWVYFKAFALTGRLAHCHNNPGRCPGLRASAPSGRAAMGLLAYLQPLCDSCPCGRIPQNAALLLARPLMVRQPYSVAV